MRWGWLFVALAPACVTAETQTGKSEPADAGARASLQEDADGAASGDAGTPYVDPDKLGPPCGPDAGVCPEEMTCARVSASNVQSETTCIRGPVCDALICPPGYACLTNDKDLKDVYCYR